MVITGQGGDISGTSPVNSTNTSLAYTTNITDLIASAAGLLNTTNTTNTTNAIQLAEGSESESDSEDDSRYDDIDDADKPLTLRPPSEVWKYLIRGKIEVMDKQKRYELTRSKGKWKFRDPHPEKRPTEDYCAEYPNRDIPWDEFPRDAWQRDNDYKGKFCEEGKALLSRVMEEILAEYGFGAKDAEWEGRSFEERRDASPFFLEFFEPEDETDEGDDNDSDGDEDSGGANEAGGDKNSGESDKNPDGNEGSDGSKDSGGRRKLRSNMNGLGGRITQDSWDGLVRRLLHAIITGDSFNLVLGGHSAAAGHGNHFQQSYAMQFQRIMEPVFARFGVKHYARNIGMGGLGTVQSAMGAQDIYGKDVDILIWDSAMTEDGASPEFDLFVRQAILGGDRAPMIWSGTDELNVYAALKEHADIDYMFYGSGMDGIPKISDPTVVDEISWAARYLKCDNEFKSLCEDNRYNGTCWIDRPDHFQPPTPQRDEPGGRASWHGGNREHQLTGRIMAFNVMRAMSHALDFWDHQPWRKVDDSMWHMTDYYENIKSKVANLDPSIGSCHAISDRLSTDFCTIPFQARTEFTPRANPEQTSLRSIMKPFGPDKSILEPEQNVYDPPDVENPVLNVPEGEVDVLALAEHGPYDAFLAPVSPLPVPVGNTTNRKIRVKDADGEKLVPGLGWGVHTMSSPNQCNGTYDSFCGRSADNECLLYGHNDFRGGLSFDSFSGWGIFTLTNVKFGKIYVKMDSWRKAKDNPVTEGWTEVNNGTSHRSLLDASADEMELETSSEHGYVRRNLMRKGKKNKKKKKKQNEDENANFCPDLVLEFAVGNQTIQVTSEEILGERHSLVQRVVQIWTVMDDIELTGGRLMDVELGIRLLGCGRQHVFWLTHIYWA